MASVRDEDRDEDVRVESEVGNDGKCKEAFLELCKGVGRARERKQGRGSQKKAEERQAYWLCLTAV